MSDQYKSKTFKLCHCACKWRCKCLIPRKKKPLPPFNLSSKRDGRKGLHPKFYTHFAEGPPVGIYDISSMKSKNNAISWKRELDAKYFSESLGGRLIESRVIQRELMEKGRGPGTHEVEQWPENILNRPCKSLQRDVGFGTSSRFKSIRRSITPGPGATVKVHNPYYYLELNRLKGFSPLPSFEYDGLAPRFREKQQSWSLPCNRYNPKDPRVLEAVLNKVTGKRGPYDLFTGPRDERTIRGYMARKTEDYRGWPIRLPGEVEKLLRKSTYYKGRISSCPRFPKISGLRMALKDISMSYRNPDDPGPGHYEPSSPRKPQNRMNYPFNISVEHVRPTVYQGIYPGPGRYNIKDRRRIKGNGWSWIFKSQVPRTIGARLPEPFNSF